MGDKAATAVLWKERGKMEETPETETFFCESATGIKDKRNKLLGRSSPKVAHLGRDLFRLT